MYIEKLKRVLVDSDGESANFAPYVDEVLVQRESCRVFDEAPHIPIAGTSVGPMSNGELQVDMASLGDAIALRAMDVFPRTLFWSQCAPKTP